MQSKLYWAIFATLAGLAAGPAANAKMPLNDTGMRACFDFDTENFSNTCTDTGQDGEFGRDITHPKNSDGRLGFSFRKICNNGEVAGSGSCPTDPKFGTAATAWGCTEDRTTGLMWEIKRPTGLRAITTYYYARTATAGFSTAASFMNMVNRRSMCGATDWRLPTVVELQGIVNYQYASYWLNPNMAFEPEQAWFPESFPPWWNSYLTADEKDADSNWTVDKGSIRSAGYGHVRLVRNAH